MVLEAWVFVLGLQAIGRWQRALAGNAVPLAAIFWLLCSLVMLAAAFRPKPRPKRLLLRLLVVSLVTCPIEFHSVHRGGAAS